MNDSVAADLIIPLPITSGILWIVWLVFVLLFSFGSWVLLHHWSYYGVKGNKRIFAKSLYFIGGIAGLVIMALLIGGYSVIR